MSHQKMETIYGKTKEEKAAIFGFSLIFNHAFVDGDKGIGVYVMPYFFRGRRHKNELHK